MQHHHRCDTVPRLHIGQVLRVARPRHRHVSKIHPGRHDHPTTGVSPAGRTLQVDAGSLNRELVLENDAVVGSVNANLRHYQAAARHLAAADVDWLHRLVTATVPLADAPSAFDRPGDDVKVVIALDADA